MGAQNRYKRQKTRKLLWDKLSRFFPIIDFTVSSSKDYFNQNIIINNNEGNKDTIYDADINFKIKEITSSIKVPLSFTKGKFLVLFWVL